MVCQTACMHIHCSTFNRPQKFSKAMHYTQMLQRLQLRKHKFRTAPRLRLQEHHQPLAGNLVDPWGPASWSTTTDLSADEKKQPSPTNKPAPVSDEKPSPCSASLAGRVDSRRRSKTAESRARRCGSRSRKTERSNTKSRHRSRSPLRRAKNCVGETQGAQPLAGKNYVEKESEKTQGPGAEPLAGR